MFSSITPKRARSEDQARFSTTKWMGRSTKEAHRAEHRIQDHDEPRQEGRPMSSDLEGFATIPRAIQRDPDVTWQEKVVYLALSSRANARNQCWPSHTTIAQDASVSVSTAKRALEALRTRGAISWVQYPGEKKGQTVNLYSLGAAVDPRSVGPSPQVSQTEPLVPTDLLTIEENDGREVGLADSVLGEAFAGFWKTYPRKKGAPSKDHVRALWARKVKTYTAAKIQLGLEQQVREWAAERPPRTPQHMPMITTWLNQERWATLDEVDGTPAVARPIEDAYAFTENRPPREPTWLDADILGEEA